MKCHLDDLVAMLGQSDIPHTTRLSAGGFSTFIVFDGTVNARPKLVDFREPLALDPGVCFEFDRMGRLSRVVMLPKKASDLHSDTGSDAHSDYKPVHEDGHKEECLPEEGRS